MPMLPTADTFCTTTTTTFTKMQKPSRFKLMEDYRDWYKTNYDMVPNSQAAIVTAEFVLHVLTMYDDEVTDND